MKAVIFPGDKSFQVGELPDPLPLPNEVVMKVHAVGLCGTDIHVLEGEFEPTVYPIVPGHEASGVVHSVGTQVKRLKPGDRVVLDPTLTCGFCRNCHEGRGNLCSNWNGMGVAKTNGATSEFVIAPESNFHLLKNDTNLTHAALIEPLACAVHAFDLLPRTLGSHYLIYGCGTMGLMMAQIAQYIGALSVSLIDTNPSKQDVARELGFDHVSGDAQLFPIEKWDVVIDCTGAIPAIEDGLNRVKPGGVFQHFGVTPQNATATYLPFDIYKNEITIIGTMAIARSFYRAVELFEQGILNPAPMISDIFPLERYSGALDLFKSGKARKILITP
jgi:2-desacetyl-2-hydroxyethyl bacteriochlorophyllide A dehydrogenase